MDLGNRFISVTASFCIFSSSLICVLLILVHVSHEYSFFGISNDSISLMLISRLFCLNSSCLVRNFISFITPIAEFIHSFIHVLMTIDTVRVHVLPFISDYVIMCKILSLCLRWFRFFVVTHIYIIASSHPHSCCHDSFVSSNYRCRVPFAVCRSLFAVRCLSFAVCCLKFTVT